MPQGAGQGYYPAPGAVNGVRGGFPGAAGGGPHQGAPLRAGGGQAAQGQQDVRLQARHIP